MRNTRLTAKDLDALTCFVNQYPSWWYRIGICDLSCDFTCAPQSHSPESPFIEVGNEWDRGFMCDHPDSLAHAIESVIEDIKYRYVEELKNG